MTKIEDFLTIKSSTGPYEIKEKGSRFISYIIPVSDKEKAENTITEFRKKYFDSTHVCFGYRVGDGEEKHLRYSDDGEPSGTAGLPIINEIKSRDLFNVLLLVIRYYGGTKLGTGGLARAYRDSAKLSIENAPFQKTIIRKSQTIMIPFSFMSDLMKIIEKFSITLTDKNYNYDGVRVELQIPISNYDAVKNAFINQSKGSIQF